MSSWLSTVSPQPDDEVPPTPRLTERKPEKEKEEGKRKRSKSMSKVKEEKEGNKGEKVGRAKKKGEEGDQANEQVDEEKRLCHSIIGLISHSRRRDCCAVDGIAPS